MKTAPILGSIVGTDRTWGALEGRTPARPLTFGRLTTDDNAGAIHAYWTFHAGPALAIAAAGRLGLAIRLATQPEAVIAAALEEARRLGFDDMNLLLRDRDLDSLRKLAEFRAVCERIERGGDGGRWRPQPGRSA